jgi:hypothetical protein
MLPIAAEAHSYQIVNANARKKYIIAKRRED